MGAGAKVDGGMNPALRAALTGRRGWPSHTARFARLCGTLGISYRLVYALS